MIVQNVKEICWKQKKGHLQCAADATMIRPWSENDPRMIRAWNRQFATRRATEATFRALHGHFVWKNITFGAPAIILNFTKYWCLEKWLNTAPARKSDTWISLNSAPATKSDPWTSPNIAPATKSDYDLTLLDSTITWIYYSLTLLLLDPTITWLFYYLTLLVLDSLRLLDSIITWPFPYLTLLLLDSCFIWRYYYLTLLWLDSTMTRLYYYLTHVLLDASITWLSTIAWLYYYLTLLLLDSTTTWPAISFVYRKFLF